MVSFSGASGGFLTFTLDGITFSYLQGSVNGEMALPDVGTYTGALSETESFEFASAQVPVPAALPLLAVALGGLVVAGRRRG